MRNKYMPKLSLLLERDYTRSLKRSGRIPTPPIGANIFSPRNKKSAPNIYT